LWGDEDEVELDMAAMETVVPHKRERGNANALIFIVVEWMPAAAAIV